MTDDRSEMEAARLAGLAKRHETRLARAQGCTCAYPDDADPAAHVGCPVHGEPKSDEVRHCGLGRPVGYHPRHKFMLGREVFQCEGTSPEAPDETREARAVRKAVGEEIAQAVLTTCTRPDVCETCQRVATLAREIGSRDPQ